MKSRWYPVRVYFPNDKFLPAFTHSDEIHAASYTDAIKKAAWNWPAATIVEIIDESEIIPGSEFRFPEIRF